MASKYYNPQVARSLGAAYVEPYVSAAMGVEKGMARAQRMKIAKMQAKQAKAAEWMKQQKDAFDNWIKYNDKIKNAPNELAKAPQPLQEYFLNKFSNNKKEYRQYLNPALNNVQRSIGFQEIKTSQDSDVSLIKDIPNRVASLNPDNISVANDPSVTKALNAQIKGEFKVSEDGMIIFNDKSIESIPVEKFGQINYIPVATEKFGEKAAQLDVILDKLAKNKVSPALLPKELDRELGDLNLTREEAISVAFDYFGKEQPGYINFTKKEFDKEQNTGLMNFEGDSEGWIEANLDVLDKNNDKYVDAGELNLWIKQQLKEAGQKSYADYTKKYVEDIADKGTGKGSKIFSDILDLAHELSRFAPYEEGVLEALKDPSIGAAFAGGKDITLVRGEKESQVKALMEKGYSEEVAKAAVEDADAKNAVVYLKNTPISNFSDLLIYYNENNYSRTNQLKFTDFNELFNELEPEARDLFKGQFGRRNETAIAPPQPTIDLGNLPIKK
jgi:hypothetical protein